MAILHCPEDDKIALAQSELLATFREIENLRNKAQEERIIAEQATEEAQKITREALANELAFKSERLLNDQNRERAFQLAEFAHLYVDADNTNVNQQLVLHCH